MQAKKRRRLIYAYHRDTEETAAFVRGKRGLKTALKLKKRINRPGITCCLDRN
jgi:IS1 family transposase